MHEPHQNRILLWQHWDFATSLLELQSVPSEQKIPLVHFVVVLLECSQDKQQ